MEAESVFFSLLQSALFDKPLSAEVLTGGIDWEAVWQLAVMHTVEGLVGETALRLPPQAELPEKMKKAMRQAMLRNVGAHSMTETALVRCVETLRSHGIEPVLLKGEGLACLYPKPKMRTCGDIDLYVGEENYVKACSIAVAELSDGSKELEKTEKHCAVRCEGVEVELHRRAADILKPSRRKALLQWEADCLSRHADCQRLQVRGCQVLIPPVTFNAVYVFLHLWFHFLTEEGIGLRQLCDWAMFLHRHAAEIDRAEVERVLRRLDAVMGWQMIGRIVVDRLGLPAAEMPLYAEREPRMTRRALRRIMQRGNFGLFAPDYPGEYQRSMPFLKRKTVRTRNFAHKYWDAAQFAPIDFTRHFAPTIWRAFSNSVLQLLGLTKREYEKPSH